MFVKIHHGKPKYLTSFRPTDFFGQPIRLDAKNRLGKLAVNLCRHRSDVTIRKII